MTSSRSTYDRIAHIYDHDIGLNAPEGDVRFYRSFATAAKGRVLEVGCGTGRISLPLVEAGCRVVGIDVSLPMLVKMNSKAAKMLHAGQRDHLRSVCMNMAQMAFDRRFPLIICPYSAFGYLLRDEDRDNFLKSVRTHLAEGGRFILDLFVPHYDVLCRADDYLYFDYRRILPNGRILERSKTIKKDLTSQVNEVTRHYRILDRSGSLHEEFSTVHCVRYSFRSEVRALLALHGFRIESEYGDFKRDPYHHEAQTMIFVCKVPSQS